MKVCSWNINSIRVRVNALNLLIEKHKPEIILLQEIKCENHQFDFSLKMQIIFQLSKDKKGNMAWLHLVKKDIDFSPIQFKSNIINEEARICGISLEKLSIINVYVPNGNPIENEEKYKFKLRWFDELSKIVKSYTANYKDLVVAGDFNVLEHENDVKDFKNWRLDALGKIDTRKSLENFYQKVYLTL